MIKLKTKTHLKTKKNINKLKGGDIDALKQSRILSLIKFICSLNQYTPDLTLTSNKSYGTNYPFIITYYDLKIILLYITLHLKDLSKLKKYNIDKMKLNEIIQNNKEKETLTPIYKLINKLCFEDKVLNKILAQSSQTEDPIICIEYPKKETFNFEFSDNSHYENYNNYKSYDDFKKYLEDKFYNIYYLFYDKMIKEKIKRNTRNNKNTNSGYSSNSSNSSNSRNNSNSINSINNSYNSAIGINSKNTKFNSNNPNNDRYTARGSSMYGRIRTHFFKTYKTIFNEDGTLNYNNLQNNIDNLLQPKIN